MTHVAAARPTFDVVVEGGTLVDGTGGVPFRADVGVRGGRIAELGDLRAAGAEQRLDASGRTVAPGFVDIHGHSDFSLLVDPGADSALAQGVTTEIIGNCGHGCAPIALPPDDRVTGNIYGWQPGIREVDWSSVGGYLDALADARPAINVGTLVPFGNLRLLALADPGAPADPSGVRRMAGLLDAALDDGALGLSSGLEYPLEHASHGGEVEALCRRVAARDRLYATHTRDRGLAVVETTGEALGTARATGVRTQVSHVLARRGSGPPDANARIADLLETAAAGDMDLAWDVHTRQFGITSVASALRPAVLALTGERLVRALADPASLRVAPDDDTVLASFGRAGWDRTYLRDAGPGYDEPGSPSVAEVAAAADQRPSDVLLRVLCDAAAQGALNRPMAFATTYSEDDIAGVVRTSRCAIGSDATTMCLEGPLRQRALPGAFTWAAWYLRRMLRECEVLPLPEGIRRITSLPAGQAGLPDRGRLAPGARADVVVFDLATLREPEDLLRPAGLASGVDHVLVNGVPALLDGHLTGARAGEVIRA